MEVFPQVKVIFNAKKPRRKSFEINLVTDASVDAVLLWSGLNRGPPRHDKFPEDQLVLETVKKYLTK